MNEIIRTIVAVTIFLPLILGGSGMARYTRPVPGRSDTYPNAGPYTADQWADLLNITHVGDEATTRGPYASYLNRLEVTNPAGADFQIDTGAGLVNGHLLINDAAVTITADTPAANPRIDRVVMVYNNTNAAIAATTVGGFTFNVAGGGTEIPAYTAELAIMKGAEAGAPVLPALEQDAARLWMVELARYQISIVPAITNFTDYRDYVDAEIKTVFVPFTTGYDSTVAGAVALGSSVYWGLVMPANSDVNVAAFWEIPQDFIDDLDATPIIVVDGAPGAVVVRVTSALTYYECGGIPTTDTVGPTNVNTSAAKLIWECLTSMVINASAPAIDDIVRLRLYREGSNGADTGGDSYAVGWDIRYLGYRR
jgi:hypothetical protein